MKNLDKVKIRNVGLFSHAGAGKTTLAEAMLFNGGIITRRGKVEEGNTVSDWQPEEIKRRISIDLSVLPFSWREYKINLVDTPGYVDFVGNIIGTLRAVDSGIVLTCAVSGVEVGTEKVFHYLSQEKLPVAFVINKMDREGANFEKTLEELKKRVTSKATPILIPIGKETNFQGIVDLLSLKAFYFDGEGKAKEGYIPEDMKETVESFRENLTENIAETNDELLNMYLEGQEIDPQTLRDALRQAIRERKIFPVLCASGLTNKGVNLITDFLVDFLPSPGERKEVQGTNPVTQGEEIRRCDENEFFSAFVFKIISDPYVGKIALFRVFSGKISPEAKLYNASRGTEEKVGQLVFLRGKNQEQTKEVIAGDIAAVAKISEIYLGNTLSDKDHPIVFPPLQYPEPNYLAAIRPLGKGDEEKISQALSRILEEDPTLRVQRDPDTKEDILYGLGDIHLDVVVDKMKRKFGVEVGLSIPRVPYKETIKKIAKAEGKYKRQ
ncbi:MAG: elongation factor G, partial [Candidatus Caldatribacteriaceae bacterium]